MLPDTRHRGVALLALLALLTLLLEPHGAGAAAPAPGPAARIHGAIDERQRVELPGHVHPALRDGVDLGDADPNQRVERLVLLLRAGPQQEAELDRLLRNQQLPGSADYHRWLTPGEFGRRFGIAQADLAIVQSWLRRQGLRVEALPAGGRRIELSGTIGQIERAFATRIRRYSWHGEPHIAAAMNPSIPAALAGVVQGFASLHDFRYRPMVVRRAPAPDYNLGAANYLAPSDFAVIYDLAAPYAQGTTGSGRSIAVLGRSSIVAGDLATFRSQFGLAANPPQVINNGTPPAVIPNDELESDLDLEWSGAVAPAATIKFVTSATTTMSDGILLSAQYAVSNNVADVISLSYGSCELSSDLVGGVPAYQPLWRQAAAQGISVFVASGDSGAAGCDLSSSASATGGLAVNELCSSPDSTCVGGTEFSADVGAQSTYWSTVNSGTAPPGTPTALRYIGESAWNESALASGGSALYSSGGGASIYYGKPYWQYATGVPDDGRRDVPDLALAAAANHDGIAIYTSAGGAGTALGIVGGTSAAAPAMAGIAALLAQRMGGRLGNVGPALYALSTQQAGGGPAVFHRITSGNNSVPGQTGFAASTADPNFNLVTGLGSPDGAALLANWRNAVPAPATLVPNSVVLPASEFIGTASLTLPAATAWSASIGGGAASWLSVTPSSGIGSDTLTYVAQANGAGAERSGTITVNGIALTVIQSAAGSGGAPTFSVTPASLAFGSIALGSTSSYQRLVVGNGGTGTLTLGTITITGAQAADFSLGGTCPAATTLAGGASCSLDMTFSPSAIGARSASLQIASNAPGSPASVTLSGTGTPGLVALSAEVPLPAWAYGVLGLALALALAGRLRVGWRRAT